MTTSLTVSSSPEQSPREYARAFEELLKHGFSLPEDKPHPYTQPQRGSSIVLLSPHPDDEVITGAFARRLQKEAGYTVINLPVTLGSCQERRRQRWEELQNACEALEWECLNPLSGELTDKDLASAIAEQIDQINPDFVTFPHQSDQHRTHRRVHGIARKALDQASESPTPVLTEFWSPMADPNLMLELTVEHVSSLITALSWHRGEIERNPYHLRLPAWLIDNVRRGSEVIAPSGAEAVTFSFATLYRVESWKDNRIVGFNTKNWWT